MDEVDDAKVMLFLIFEWHVASLVSTHQ